MQSNFRLNKLQLVALLALLFTAAFAIAQGIVTGSISGTVEDAQGAVLNNAKVMAKEAATNREYTGQTSDAGISHAAWPAAGDVYRHHPGPQLPEVRE